MSDLRDTLNKIISAAEESRNLKMPLIGDGHAGTTGGIFSLLKSPGDKTAGSGAVDSGVVDIDNPDQTAKRCKRIYERLGIPKSVITPWNAFGGYNENTGKCEITTLKNKKNVDLCQSLLDVAAPAALIAQGYHAQKMADCLQFSGKIYRVPHPGQQSINFYKSRGRDAEKEIENAFREAFILSNNK